MDAATAVLILFCLAALGLSQIMSDRRDRKDRVNMEWRLFTQHLKGIGLLGDDEGLQRYKEKFFAQRGMKVPKN